MYVIYVVSLYQQIRNKQDIINHKAMTRTLSNGFSIDQAKTAEELDALKEKAVLGIDFPFMCYPEVTVSENQAKRFSNGGELSADRLKVFVSASFYRVYVKTDYSISRVFKFRCYYSRCEYKDKGTY